MRSSPLQFTGADTFRHVSLQCIIIIVSFRINFLLPSLIRNINRVTNTCFPHYCMVWTTRCLLDMSYTCNLLETPHLLLLTSFDNKLMVAHSADVHSFLWEHLLSLITTWEVTLHTRHRQSVTLLYSLCYIMGLTRGHSLIYTKYNVICWLLYS